ncbi:ribonuclease VapC [Comamonadaceae bacterium]|nr:ribonuclease VapC [Comamonadaceae bacterium]
MLDTDTCIFLMRGESPALAARVQSVPLQQQVMSAVTFAELTYGVQASAAAKRKQNQSVLDSLVLHLAVLDWPQDAAKHYAEIRADLKKRGAQLGAADLMIAAHARAVGAIVVTNNVKDFERVKSLEVENWTK